MRVSLKRYKCTGISPYYEQYNILLEIIKKFTKKYCLTKQECAISPIDFLLNSA